MALRVQRLFNLGFDFGKYLAFEVNGQVRNDITYDIVSGGEKRVVACRQLDCYF